MSKYFHMDGSRHYEGGHICGCVDACKKCGGIVHTQGAYGALLKDCENCDIDDWCSSDESDNLLLKGSDDA